MKKTSRLHKLAAIHHRYPRLSRHTRHVLEFLLGFGGGAFVLLLLLIGFLYAFDHKFEGRAFPGIRSDEQLVSGLTAAEIKNIWLARNKQFTDASFTFTFEDKIATLSAADLHMGFDATTSALQAYSVGRSGGFLSNLYYKYLAWATGVNLQPIFVWQTGVLDETLSQLSQEIDIPAQNALFEFVNNKVTAFKPAATGRKLQIEKLKDDFTKSLTGLINAQLNNQQLVFVLPVIPVEPEIGNEKVNNMGIKELIGKGESEFVGSIPGRIHNVILGAARVNGTLVPPGDIFSFNQALGDVSAATGYKQAYVIKNGRTVLDDGGGVCQVSTTLFRAALNAGLPIVERHAHSYQVGFYMQGGWKPGFDATVIAPSYDLKIKNDTGHYILIQTTGDALTQHLTFELYGTKDGRVAQISPVRLWDPRPALATVYQDDPTLPLGTQKQVDWSETGIKASFDYRVTKNGAEIFKDTFYSDFQPWAAVYLKGTHQ